MFVCHETMTITKCLLYMLLVVLPINCLYQGESCIAENKPGTCKLLSKCPNILNEIKRAGTPLSSHLRKKLLRLGCGFEYDEPLICCDSETDNTPGDVTNYPNGWSDPRPGNQWGSNDNEGLFSTTNNFDNNSPNLQSKNSLPDISRHRNLQLLPVECGPIEGERIFGGNRTRLFEMPWMVLLSYDSPRGTKLSCGGTLINRWYVLTAAHCISFLGTKLKLREVTLGEYDVRRDPDCERIEGEQFCAPKVRKVGIGSLIAHPGYNPQRLADDIGLIRLSEPADFSLDSMKPICLPTTPELQSEKLEGLQGVVAGWGATEDGLQSPVLLSVDLPIITNTECNNVYNGSPEIYNTQLCAGGMPDKDSCGGDSGGPLMYPGKGQAVGVRYVQRGIVSFGSKRCGIGGFPGVYTRIAYYMKWILDNIHE